MYEQKQSPTLDWGVGGQVLLAAQPMSWDLTALSLGFPN